jgi:hypothetical protein
MMRMCCFWVIWKLLIQKFEQYGTRVWKTCLVLEGYGVW